MQPGDVFHPRRDVIQEHAHVGAIHFSGLLADRAGAQPQQADDEAEIIGDAMISLPLEGGGIRSGKRRGQRELKDSHGCAPLTPSLRPAGP